MSGDSPPPYSTIVASAQACVEPPRYPNTELPFSDSDDLAVKILALVSEGQRLDSRFRRIRDVVFTGAEFEHQKTTLTLCHKFEALVWESRNIAGVALVAAKDFNEVVLDFLSEPDVAVQDRLQELVNASKLLQRERNSAVNQRTSADDLIKKLENFRRTIHPEFAPPPSQRQKQSHSVGKGNGDACPLWKWKHPNVRPYPQPVIGFSIITASFGTFSHACVDHTLHLERMAEMAVFPSRVSSPPQPPREASPAPATPTLPERKRLCPPTVEHAELAALPRTVDALVYDLRAFARRIDILNTVFAELTREQDIFMVYLKDGQSVVNQGYRSEINRLRRHLPRVCGALDVYSKAKSS